MLQETNRKKVIIAFIVGIVFIIAILASSWSAFLEKDKLGVWPVLHTVFAIASIAYLFKIARELSDVNAFNIYVNQQVSEGRTALLEEIKQKEEKKREQEEKIDDASEQAKKIIPTGSFKNIDSFGKKFLVKLANKMNMVQGVLYIADEKTNDFNFCVGYALAEERIPENFKLGENLNGEAAKSQELIVVNEIPEDYFQVESGLGKAQLGYLNIIPIIDNKKTIAVVELASFNKISEKNINILKLTAELVSQKIKQIVKA